MERLLRRRALGSSILMTLKKFMWSAAEESPAGFKSLRQRALSLLNEELLITEADPSVTTMLLPSGYLSTETRAPVAKGDVGPVVRTLSFCRHASLPLSHRVTHRQYSHFGQKSVPPNRPNEPRRDSSFLRCSSDSSCRVVRKSVR